MRAAMGLESRISAQIAAHGWTRRNPMAAVLIKALTALVVLIAVPIALAELCIIVVGLWTLFHWPKGG